MSKLINKRFIKQQVEHDLSLIGKNNNLVKNKSPNEIKTEIDLLKWRYEHEMQTEIDNLTKQFEAEMQTEINLIKLQHAHKLQIILNYYKKKICTPVEN